MSTILADSIRNIKNNGAYSEVEKKRQIEAVMADNQRLQSQIMVNTVEADNINHTCTHYPLKRCSKFFFSCCGVIDPCHWCHRDRGCTAPIIDSIECSECNTRQPPAHHCSNSNCNIQFSKNYCNECHLWTEKDIVHCNLCGFCRVGLPGRVQHCLECDSCYPIDIIATHVCTRKSSRSLTCPICAESVYASQKVACILPCKHIVHQTCLTDSLQKGHYRCPLCRKCMGDMQSTWAEMRHSIEMQPMIPEYLPPIREGDIVECPEGDFIVKKIHTDDTSLSSMDDCLCDGVVNLQSGEEAPRQYQMRYLRKKMSLKVYCFDCDQKSETSFHFVGLECKNCGGFNTTRD